MTMRALGVRSFGKADKVELLSIPIPTIVESNDILVQVKAISLERADSIRIAGYSRLVEKTVKLPLVISNKYAGIVSEVGSSVTPFVPGDRVYGFTFGGRCAAEYVLLSSEAKYHVSKIPDELSFDQAAALIADTAVGGLLRADAEIEGGLKGKTVLVPGGLGGVGSIAVQLLKPVFGVEKVITTVSTKKVPLLTEVLGDGLVDQVIDYTTEDVVRTVGKGTVDFFFDTVGVAMPYLEVVKPKTGFLLAIVGKSGQTLSNEFPDSPWWMVKMLDVLDGIQKWRASRYGVRFDHIHTQMTDENPEKIAEWVREGKLKAIIGKSADMDDLNGVREALDTAGSTKGAIGRFVIKID